MTDPKFNATARSAAGAAKTAEAADGSNSDKDYAELHFTLRCSADTSTGPAAFKLGTTLWGITSLQAGFSANCRHAAPEGFRAMTEKMAAIRRACNAVIEPPLTSD
jgi:hypothetical protein